MATRLYYFNARNRAEFIRWLLAYKGIQYEDRRVDFAEWGTLKSTFEFGQIPVLDIDGRQLVTSAGIGRYVAQKHGLYPTDVDLIYLSESSIEFISDLIGQYDRIAYRDKNWAGWDEYLRTEGVQRLKILEKRLKDAGNHFFTGPTLSLVDFVVAAYIHNHYYLEGQEQRLVVLEAETPALKAFVDRFLAAAPAVADYIRTRPPAYA